MRALTMSALMLSTVLAFLPQVSAGLDECVEKDGNIATLPPPSITVHPSGCDDFVVGVAQGAVETAGCTVNEATGDDCE